MSYSSVDLAFLSTWVAPPSNSARRGAITSMDCTFTTFMDGIALKLFNRDVASSSISCTPGSTPPPVVAVDEDASLVVVIVAEPLSLSPSPTFFTLRGAGRQRQHRRLPHPDTYTLSLDVCGPFKEGEDIDGATAKYFMVGVFTIRPPKRA